MGLWLCRRVDRGDGVETTMLRKNTTADAGDDAWLDSEAEVETGETVEFIKKEVSLPQRRNDRPGEITEPVCFAFAGSVRTRRHERR